MNAHPDSDGEPPDDPAALLDRAGIDAAGLARRKAAIGLDDADAERLSALQPVLRERRSAVLQDVTDALADRHSTAEGDGWPRSERVERTWRTELTGLGAGRYDEEFARDRAAVALATSDADVQLSEYFAVHGRTYDRVFAAIETQVVSEIETTLESWLEEQASGDSSGVLGGLANAVSRSDGEASEDDLDRLRSTIRGAVSDGLADAGALARAGALDAGIAADVTNARLERRVECARRRRRSLLAEIDGALAGPLGNVHATADSVATSASSITELAGAQAEAVPAAAAELDDLTATVEEVAATAEEVRDASVETEERADAGLASAREAVEEMEAVRSATEGLVTVVEELEKRAERIDAIAAGIDDVASRSKVLASNARAQANRDVDAKRSLAVLSEEVSAFADETRDELGDLPAEITALREVAEALGREVERADDRVTEGANRLAAVEDEIETMATAAETTASNMEDVAAATDRQATAAESIAESVDRVARRSEQIAAETESVAAATEEQATALGAVVDELERIQAEHGPAHTDSDRTARRQ